MREIFLNIDFGDDDPDDPDFNPGESDDFSEHSSDDSSDEGDYTAPDLNDCEVAMMEDLCNYVINRKMLTDVEQIMFIEILDNLKQEQIGLRENN